jgi:hypothetical protein
VRKLPIVGFSEVSGKVHIDPSIHRSIDPSIEGEGGGRDEKTKL